MEIPSAGSSPRVKERWEAGPPSCLLRRVGLAPTSVNFEGLTEWDWCPPAGGQKAEARQRSHRRSIPTKSLGSWDRRQLLHVKLEEVRLRDNRLLQEQMVTIYTHLGMLSRGKFCLFHSTTVMRGLDPRICRRH